MEQNVGSISAVIEKPKIVSGNDTSGHRPVHGDGKNKDQKPVAYFTADAKQATKSSEGNAHLGNSSTNTPGTQLGREDKNDKFCQWNIPDPDYRAIKSWDNPSENTPVTQLGHENKNAKLCLSILPDLDYRAIKSWDNPSPADKPLLARGSDLPEGLDVVHNVPRRQVRFALPPKASLQPKTALGTSAPPSPRPTTVPSDKKLTSLDLAKVTVTTIQSLTAPKSKDIQTPCGYVIPAAFDPFKYGRPSTTRTEDSSKLDVGYVRPAYGYSTSAEKNVISTEPRSIVIKNLPANPTFAMISLICTNAGRIETITLHESLKKARVIFVHSADAEKFFTDAGSGHSFEFQRNGQKIQHLAKVEMKYNVDFLSAPTHTLVTKKKATRVVRIVGLDREGLEYLVDSEEVEQESFNELLVKLAGLYAYSGIEGRVEGATWGKNEKGVPEANLIYSRIKDACCALVALKQETELGQCKITYGKDP